MSSGSASSASTAGAVSALAVNVVKLASVRSQNELALDIAAFFDRSEMHDVVFVATETVSTEMDI